MEFVGQQRMRQMWQDVLIRKEYLSKKVTRCVSSFLITDHASLNSSKR
jgi:hypothetical protein